MARKKNSDKVKDSILEEIEAIQISTLGSLKTSTANLKKEVDRLIVKLESEGTKGYYSINSDVLRFSQSVWSACWRLGELKRFENKIRERDIKSKRNKEK